MPLNLEQKVDELTGECGMAGMETYKVYPAHPAYQFIWHVCLSINAMGIAVCAIKNQQMPTDVYLSFACKAHDLTVRLPAHSMVEDVMKQSAGDRPWIEVCLVLRKEPGKNEGWAIGIRRWMWLTVAVGFVELFERHTKRAHHNNHEVAQMAKVIRDSCAHGLQVTSSRSGGAKLDGLTITREDHGKPLSDFVGLGDFFVLALRMFNEPTVPQPPKGKEQTGENG